MLNWLLCGEIRILPAQFGHAIRGTRSPISSQTPKEVASSAATIGYIKTTARAKADDSYSTSRVL